MKEVLKIPKTDLKDFLDAKVRQYNTLEFIERDPIKIPHTFTEKEDIEIAAFLTATIAWGNRVSIIKSAERLMGLIDHAPSEFIKNHQRHDLEKLSTFVHRTFNGCDCIQFITSLQHLYKNYGGLEGIFSIHAKKEALSSNKSKRLQTTISKVKRTFFEIDHLARTEKHFSDPLKNSAAKRINMFLRWMVRKDLKGVDFGIWTQLSPAQLSCPLDVHSGAVARKLGLITRKQNDAKTLLELDTALRGFDATDPVKYDFALFGLGVFEEL